MLIKYRVKSEPQSQWVGMVWFLSFLVSRMAKDGKGKRKDLILPKYDTGESHPWCQVKHVHLISYSLSFVVYCHLYNCSIRVMDHIKDGLKVVLLGCSQILTDTWQNMNPMQRRQHHNEHCCEPRISVITNVWNVLKRTSWTIFTCAMYLMFLGG